MLNNLFQLDIKAYLVYGFFLSFLMMSAQEEVTTIYGDQGGFFTSSTVTPLTATDSNNLLGFTADGVTYSTGVDDSVLTSNGITFTAANFFAFPIPGVINYNTLELLGVAYNWGGVNQTNLPTDYINSFSPIVPTNFVKDGTNGLEMSTNFFNINAQDIEYDDLTVLSTANINDNIPDIIVNQTGAPGSSSDTFRFVDNLGNTVGNSVVVDFSSTPVVAGVDWTIYRVNTNTGSVDSAFGVNTFRDYRVLSFLLSDFGITVVNSPQIVGFVHSTSGGTDIAFTAYNSDTLGFGSSVDLNITTSILSSTSLCATTVVDLVSTVTNASGNDNNGFVVEAPLPSGLSYANSTAVFSSGSGSATYDTILNEWVIFGLQAGESVILTLQTSVSSITLPLSYNAQITNLSQTDTDLSNNTSSISENDIDCDGIYDSGDVDNDNDGILDTVEDENLDLDNDPLTNPTDTDGDLIPDYLDLDSDNDGIYDVDEAGNTALDTNNDGVVDTNDAGFTDLDTNGADDDAEATTPIDTGIDGSFDFQNTDSDGDGCSDANEAYNNANADGSDGGQFGTIDPATVNPTNGLVTETGVDYTLGTNASVIDDLISVCICDITSISSSNIDACNDNGTTSNIIDDTFTADITVVFTSKPGSGTLDLTGDGTASVSIIGLTSPHTFVDVVLPADGRIIDLTATFSADGACTFTNTNVLTAPFECSDDACPDIIPTGNPTTAITTGVTFDITGTGPASGAILNSISVAGEPNPFTEYYIPTAVSYGFTNEDALNQYILDGVTAGPTIDDGPGVFDPALLATFSDRDLTNYLSTNNSIDPADFTEIYYDAPISAASNRYLVMTERDGNNTYEVQALDAAGDPTGSVRTAFIPNYIDTGITTTVPGQNIFANIYPLTAFVGSGNDIHGFRITYRSSSVGDGGDGKAFIFYDPSFLTPPPTIEPTTSAVQPTCPSNEGSITIDATDNGGGTIEYSVNGAAGPWQTSNVFNNLIPGTYTPAVRYQSTITCLAVSNNPITLDGLDCPSIEAVKTVAITNDVAPAGASLGDTVTYTITVANTGNVTLDGVGIVDTFEDANGNTLTLATGPTFVSTNQVGGVDGTLRVGEIATYTATYVIEQDAVDAGGFSNSVLADGDSPMDTNVDDTSDDDDDLDGNTDDDPTETTISEDPSIEAVKTVAITNDVAPAGASLGDTVTYTITVANTGNVTLDGVGIVDTFEDANGNTLTLATGPTFVSTNQVGGVDGTLRVGEIATYTATYVIEQDAVDAGGFSNSVLADGDSPMNTNVDDTSDDDDDLDGNTDDDPTETTISEDPSIEAVKTVAITNDVAPAGASLGDTVTYTITVANTGNVTLDGVGIVDTFEDANGNTLTLATGPTFVSTNQVGGVDGTLRVGEIATYTATYVIEQDAVDAGGFSNSVLADGDSPMDTNVDDTSDDDDDLDGNTDDDPTETTISEDPSIEAVKTVAITNDVAPAGASLGDTVTYTITVANTGNVTLDGVGIVDTFEDANGNALTLATGPTFVSTNQVGGVDGTLRVGEIATYTATYVIEQDAVDAGGFSNSVLADGDSPMNTNVDDTSDDDDDLDGNTDDDPTVTVILEDPSIEAVKTVAITNDVAPAGASLGDTVTYTITVANTGNVTLDGVGIVDTFEDANGNTLTLATGPTFVSTNQVGGVDGTLRVGEIATYTATYVIEQDAVDAGGFSNSVLADGDSPMDTNVDDTSDDDDDLDGNTDDDPTETTIGEDPSIEAVKTVAITNDVAPAGASLGDTVTYAITVANTGNIVLDGVGIVDTFEDANGNALTLATGPTFVSTNQVGGVDGTLRVGEIATYTATYVIEQDAVDAGGFSNSVLADGDSPMNTNVDDTSDDDDDLDGNTEDDPTETTISEDPSIEAVKTVAITNDVAPAGASLGDTVTYTITVANTGNIILDGVGIVDTFEDANGNALTLATGPTFVSTNQVGGVDGTLRVGEIATYTATYVIEQDAVDAGGFSNSVLADGDSPMDTNVDDTSDDDDDLDGNTDDDPTVTVILEDPSIEAVKTVAITNDVAPAGASLGDTVTYTITVANTGNVTLDGVGIVDTFEDANGNTLTLATGPTFVSTNQVGGVDGTLRVGEIATYTATYVIEQDAVDAGGFSNSVLADGDSPMNTNVDDTSDDDDDLDGNTDDDPTETTISEDPSIEAVKTVAITNDVAPAGASLGDTVTYTITVANTGNVTLDGVGIVDTFEDANGNTLTLATGPTFVSTNQVGGVDGTLRVGEIATYTATYVIEQDAVDAGGFSNSVLADGDSPMNTNVDDTSDDDDDLDGNTDDDPTETTISEDPSIEAVKTVAITNDVAPAGASLGDTVTYTITVANTGNVTLDGVGIVDTFEDANGNTLTLATGPTFVSTNQVGGVDGTLRVGEIATYTATYVIEQDAVDAGGFSNSVLADGDSPMDTNVDDTSDDDDDTDGNTEDDPTVTTIGEDSSIEAVKTVAITNDVAPVGVSLGDTMTYTITVTNTGNVTLDGVGIVDTFLDGDGNALTLTSGPTFQGPSSLGSLEGDLLVGEVATYTATYVVAQDAVDAGGFSNSVLADGDSPMDTNVDDTSDDDDDLDGNTDDDPTVTTIGEGSSIEAVKTVAITNDVAPVGVSLGDTMTYTITVTNTGNVTLDGVGIVDTFLDGDGNALTLTSGPTFQGPSSLGSLEGDLLVGEVATYTTTYVVAQDAVDAGGFSNSVLADGDSPMDTNVDDTSDDDDDTDGNTEDDPTVTVILEDPSIEAVKTVAITNDVAPVGVSLGDTMTYTITVTNTGNVTLDGVGIVDTFLDGDGNALTLTSGPTFQGPSSLGSLEGDLLVGEVATYTATYVVAQDAVDAGGFSNSVLADGDSPMNTNVDDTSDDDDDTDGNTEDDPTVTVILEDPSIEAVKTVAITNDVAPVGVSLGDTMTYTITVTNTGNVTLDGVGIVDTFLDGDGNALTLTSGPTFQGPSSLGSLEGDLLVGEVATYTATYVVAQDAVDAGGFSNSVLADGDSPMDTNVDDTSDDDDDTDGNTEDDPTVTTIGEDSSIEAVKTVAITNDVAPVGVSLGDTMTYTITVTNTGNVTLDGVGIVDTFLDGDGNALTLTSGPTFQGPSSLGSLEGDLLVGEVATYTATYVVAQDAVDAGGFSNSVLADGDSPMNTNVDDTSDDDDDTDGNTEDDPTVTVILEDPSIEAVKTVAITNDVAPVGVSLGDTVTYTITVANTGNVTLDGVGIVDTFEDANGNTLTLATGPTFVSTNQVGGVDGTLRVGEIATYTATYVIEQDAVDAGGFSNSVLADGDSPMDANVDDTSDDDDDLDGNTDDDPTETTISEDPSIEAVKTVAITNDVAPAGASLGDTVTYTITVANTGNVTLDGVGIVDTFEDANGNALTLATGPTFVSTNQVGGVDGTLRVGEIATYTATYVIEQDAVDAGGFSNSVLADGDSPMNTNVDDTSDDDDDLDGNTDDDPTETTISEDPSIEAVKTVAITNDVAPAGASLGDTVTYTITVANTGNVTLDGVGIVDTFEDANGNTLTLATGPTFVSTNQVGGVDGTLRVGEIATYTATYVIEQDAVDAGGFSNSVLADGDSPMNTNVDDTSDDDDDTDGNTEDDPTEIVIVSNPSISLIKTALPLEDTNGDGIAGSIDDFITYAFTVTNTGNVTLTNVQIQDTLPGINLMGGPIAVLLPNQPDSSTFTATYQITQADLDTGFVINSATVSGEAPGGDTGDPSDDITDTSDDPNDNSNTDDNGDGEPDDPTITEVNSIYDLEVTKVVNELTPVVGDEVIFTIEAANIGNVTTTNIVISEQIPSGYVYVSHIVTAGTYSEFDGEWTITQLNPDQVEILEITVEVLGFGDYLNSAFVSSSLGGTDVNPGNDEGNAIVDPICLTIYNEFSPNGDGVNETFVIDCLERYTNNKLEVYNRWGNIVYSKNRYLNDWDGTSNGRAVINQSDKLPVGTYYYVLDLGDGSEPRVGWLYINR
ncbi:T9SS C-terminal target domain-containing protein [Winogradskyella sp. PG-2]|uniref:T9SS C-terminal target domain-containing protein n=1 Tax=Winogradskyella sp. PG-2 TaxID=754409 RepID=UPI00045863F0|nr:T9SS C-terminal target domain-containing protein [Winogradskyella sp. PG-2]BAO76682.1 internalin, putative [Winogradskyella sp. PG-2]